VGVRTIYGLFMITMQTLADKRAQIARVAEARRVYDVRVFGSFARGDNTQASDVDFLVKPRPGCTLFDLGGFLADLQDLLGCPVDVVTDETLKPRLRSRVLAEARAV
jgi:predicted nucleotidyltransferase